MNVERELKLAGFENLKALLKELNSNGKLIEDLPYPLRLNPEVILASVQKYPKAIKYIDKDYVTDTFLAQIFIRNIGAFIKLNPHISEWLFERIIGNIAYIKNLKTDTKIQDKLYEVFDMLPIKYIIEYGNLINESELFTYYSSEKYMEKSKENKSKVIEKILAFESVLQKCDFNVKENVNLLLEVIIPKFGDEYYEIFAKYINSKYTVNAIIESQQKLYYIPSTNDFLFYYIKTLSNANEILALLYGLFDFNNYDLINEHFKNDDDKIIEYFSSLLENVCIDKAIFADKLFVFLVKNTNIDSFKLIQMFKDYINFVDFVSGKYCEFIDNTYHYLLSSTTDKKERKLLESFTI